MISFSNPTRFDVQPLTMMGLSAKQSSNSIGRFGTGLKYAVAIILRNGGNIRIRRRGDTDLTFSEEEKTFRGQTFSAVILHDDDRKIELPFTLDYGKDWKPWMALRELFSNALDEGGGVGTTGETVIEVTGSVFEDAWANRDFWYQQPVEKITDSFFATRTPGIFYQGFKIGVFEDAPDLGIWTDRPQRLTEDRQISSHIQIYTDLGRELLENAPTPEQLNFFHCLPEQLQARLVFWCTGLHENALNYADQPNAPLCLIKKASEMRQERGVFIPAPLSALQNAQFEAALAIVRRIELNAAPSDFNFTSSIQGAVGIYVPKKKEIWISHKAFSSGVLDLAATLYEEYCHKKYDLPDGRPMQEHFLRTLLSFVEVLK